MDYINVFGNFNGKGHDGNLGFQPNNISGSRECLLDVNIPNGLSLVSLWLISG